MSNFSIALKSQARAINALFMRELQTRFGTKKIGFFWAIFESLAHVTVFALIKHFLGLSGPDGINVILFLITGIVPFFYFRNILTRMIGSLESNQNLLSITKIHFLDFFYARFLLESFLIFITLPAIMLIGIIVVSNLEIYYFTGYQVNNLMQVLSAVFYLGVLGFGFGLIVSSINVFIPSCGLVVNAVLRVTYLTSGVIFSIDSRIPYNYHDILYYNPIVHCMEILRAGFFFEYTQNEHFMDYSYLSILSLASIFIGLITINRSKAWVLK